MTKIFESNKDVKLSRPIEISGATVSALRMREPTVLDQQSALEMKGSQATQEITLFANLCDVTPDDIRKLALRDYKKLSEAYAGFLDDEAE